MSLHIAISGGGTSIIKTLSCLKNLYENETIKHENIKSIYGTSSGSIAGVILCLNYDWITIHDYIVKRPWNNIFSVDFSINGFINLYYKRGLFGPELLNKVFEPLFLGKDLSMDITLKEFYNYSGEIEFHFFTFELNAFEIIDISYKTHPDLKLMDAIYMSCSLPIAWAPLIKDNKCFIDGGIMYNYPLKFCVENTELHLDSSNNTIIGIKNIYDEVETTQMPNNLLEFIYELVMKIIYKFNKDNDPIIITNTNNINLKEINLNQTKMTLDFINEVLNSEEVREKLWNL
jgi:predicted acylesterase/phospholipase RssA